MEVNSLQESLAIGFLFHLSQGSGVVYRQDRLGHLCAIPDGLSVSFARPSIFSNNSAKLLS